MNPVGKPRSYHGSTGVTVRSSLRLGVHKYSISLLTLLMLVQSQAFAQDEGQDEGLPGAQTPTPEAPGDTQSDPLLDVLSQDIEPPSAENSATEANSQLTGGNELGTVSDTIGVTVTTQEQSEYSGLDVNVEELSVLELQDQFMLRFDDEQHEAARDLGEVIVRRMGRELGRDALELVIPLNNLATVYELLGNYDAAEQNYQRSVSLVENKNGQYHVDLIRPLTGLAITYESAGRHEEAIAILRRAQHLTHRMDGVYSPEQLSLLQRISGNFVKMNDFGEADRAQRLWFKVNEHNVGRDNIDILPALYQLAEWYVHSGQYTNAINAYNRGVDILEDEFGEEDLRLLTPLRGIAEAGGGRARTNSRSIKALERADHILGVNPDADPFDRALTLIELADVYTVTNKSKLAKQKYAEAWTALSESQEEDEAKRELFGKPVKLFHPILYMSQDTFNRRANGEYFVDIQFMVTPTGQVTDVKVVESNAPPDARRLVRQMARRARYRPRFENGVAISTEGVESRQKVVIVEQQQACDPAFPACRQRR